MTVMLSVIMLSGIMLSVIMLSVPKLSVIMLRVITLSVIMKCLSVIMLCAIMQSVIMLSVAAPWNKPELVEWISAKSFFLSLFSSSSRTHEMSQIYHQKWFPGTDAAKFLRSEALS